jgi:ribokinase
MADPTTNRSEVSVVVVGSTMIDMIAYVGRVPDAGETVVGDRFVQGFGGKGANQAVMARRLGASVRMVARVGDDQLGGTTIDNLAREGIDVSRVLRTAGTSSGVAPIWVEPDGTNRIIVVPGANDHLAPAEAADAVETAGSVHVVVGQFEVPQTATAAAFGAARRRGATTVLNPAPAAEVSPELLATTDWLAPNEVEFAHLARAVGVDPDGPVETRGGEVAERLGTSLVVTMGEQGALVVELGGDPLAVAAPAVTAVDTTGAGDAFVGAFAYGLGSGLRAQEAAALGCRCASLSVTRPGTQTSFPTSDELATR